MIGIDTYQDGRDSRDAEIAELRARAEKAERERDALVRGFWRAETEKIAAQKRRDVTRWEHTVDERIEECDSPGCNCVSRARAILQDEHDALAKVEAWLADDDSAAGEGTDDG